MTSPQKTVVVFPGTGYTCSTGLLADGIQHWQALGYHVIPLDFSHIPFADIETFSDAFDAAEASALRQLAEENLDHCIDLVFFSKSLGTVVAPRCAAALRLHPRMLYLTPLPETLALTGADDQVIGMVVGTRDPLIDWHVVQDFCNAKSIPCLVCEKVGHSLADPSDSARTEAIRQQVLALCRPF